MQIRGVILDVDGTLVDSNDAHTHAYIEAMAAHGFPDVPFEKVRASIGKGGDKLLPDTIGVEKDSASGKAIGDSKKKIFTEKYQPHVVATPGARDLIARLHADGIKLVIGTSGEADEVQPLLKIAGVEEFLTDIASAKDAASSKPDPDIVGAALKKLGLAPEYVFLLGDTPYDVQASLKVNVDTIALRCGGWKDNDLRGAKYIYDNPADLLAHYAGVVG